MTDLALIIIFSLLSGFTIFLGGILAHYFGNHVKAGFIKTEILKTKHSARKCLLILFLLSFSGIISALTGYYFFADMPMTVGGIMLFSAGGIIYLIFQDIAPMSKLKRTRNPLLEPAWVL